MNIASLYQPFSCSLVHRNHGGQNRYENLPHVTLIFLTLSNINPSNTLHGKLLKTVNVAITDESRASPVEPLCVIRCPCCASWITGADELPWLWRHLSKYRKHLGIMGYWLVDWQLTVFDLGVIEKSWVGYGYIGTFSDLILPYHMAQITFPLKWQPNCDR